MAHYIVGGMTEYYLSDRFGDPTYGNWDTQFELEKIENWLTSVGDPNAINNPDLYEEWGETAVIYQPSGIGKYATAEDRLPTWYGLVAVGKTNIDGYDVPIWYRTFFVFTEDAQRPNAVQIVGGKQFFWWDSDKVITDHIWGYETGTWIGIGISGELKVGDGSVVGKAFFDQHISGVGNYLLLPLGNSFGDGADLPDPIELQGIDIPISPAQLIAVAKHDPWGWCLSQIRLYTTPATYWAELQLVGWKERVRDMDEQQDYLVTNKWGNSSTETSFWFQGQWWTGQWKWGPSIISFHFAPNNQPRPSTPGCFIATSCYGDYNAPEVLILRQYRDNNLLCSFHGRMFVKFYYFVSPFIARALKKSNFLKKLVKEYFLNPIVAKLRRHNCK